MRLNTNAEVSDFTWMRRCFDLASRGIGYVSPNPPVGAVLIWQNQILGEGYHRQYGGAHAEVEAILSVPDHRRHLIPQARLYVSLEPCCVFGKTPPCTNLILDQGIHDVRISTLDPNPAVAGKGLEILRAAGVRVSAGILEEEGQQLIRAFRTNILKHRPHIILKWAQSRWGIIGVPGQQVWLSHPDTSVWTHGQRAEADAILIGARTVETDNPTLTTRNYPGQSPFRVVIDPNGRLNRSYKVFQDDGCRVFYFSYEVNSKIDGDHISTECYPAGDTGLRHILQYLFQQQIGVLLIEGGAQILQLFIREHLWDEAWVIRTQHSLEHGIAAPIVHGRLIRELSSGSDVISGIENQIR